MKFRKKYGILTSKVKGNNNKEADRKIAKAKEAYHLQENPEMSRGFFVYKEPYKLITLAFIKSPSNSF